MTKQTMTTPAAQETADIIYYFDEQQTTPYYCTGCTWNGLGSELTAEGCPRCGDSDVRRYVPPPAATVYEAAGPDDEEVAAAAAAGFPFECELDEESRLAEQERGDDFAPLSSAEHDAHMSVNRALRPADCDVCATIASIQF